MSIFDDNVTNIRFRDLYKLGKIFNFESDGSRITIGWLKENSCLLNSVSNPEYLYYQLKHDAQWLSHSKPTAAINHIVKVCLDDCWVKDEVKEIPKYLEHEIKLYLEKQGVAGIDEIEVKITDNFERIKFGNVYYEFPFIEKENDINKGVLHILIHFDHKLVYWPLKLISIILL